MCSQRPLPCIPGRHRSGGRRGPLIREACIFIKVQRSKACQCFTRLAICMRDRARGSDSVRVRRLGNGCPAWRCAWPSARRRMLYNVCSMPVSSKWKGGPWHIPICERKTCLAGAESDYALGCNKDDGNSADFLGTAEKFILHQLILHPPSHFAEPLPMQQPQAVATM